MRAVTLLDAETGAVVCEPCELAARPWSRMRGLLGRRGLAPGHGMLFTRTHAIHTAGMRFPIDVVFLDRELVVGSVAAHVPAWRTASHRGARWTLELAAGEAERLGLSEGRRLVIAGER